MSIQGKTFVVCGTSANIGAGIALGLAERGAAIACLDLRAEHATRCADAIGAQGGRAEAFEVDVTDAGRVARIVGQVAERLGPIDVLVNAAGFYNEQGLLDMPVQEWRRQIDVILTGAFIATQAVARQMIERGITGAVINLSSTAGHQGQPGNIAYSSAKAGILNFTRAAAMDLAPHGIRVNSLTPTTTDPREGQQRLRDWAGEDVPVALSDKQRQSLELVPLQAFPRPSDYARAAAFLASDDAGMITGTDLRVDSGVIAKYWRWRPLVEGS